MLSHHSFCLSFLLIYFWLHWVLVAVCTFSYCSGWSLVGAQEFWCKGLVALWHDSWTRDQTHVPCIGRQIPNHWTTRKSSFCLSFMRLVFRRRRGEWWCWTHGKEKQNRHHLSVNVGCVRRGAGVDTWIRMHAKIEPLHSGWSMQSCPAEISKVDFQDFFLVMPSSGAGEANRRCFGFLGYIEFCEEWDQRVTIFLSP